MKVGRKKRSKEGKEKKEMNTQVHAHICYILSISTTPVII